MNTSYILFVIFNKLDNPLGEPPVVSGGGQHIVPYKPLPSVLLESTTNVVAEDVLKVSEGKLKFFIFLFQRFEIFISNIEVFICVVYVVMNLIFFSCNF